MRRDGRGEGSGPGRKRTEGGGGGNEPRGVRTEGPEGTGRGGKCYKHRDDGEVMLVEGGVMGLRRRKNV